MRKQAQRSKVICLRSQVTQLKLKPKTSDFNNSMLYVYFLS